MALQFILGKSGAGKSYALYKKIVEQSQKHPEKKYLVVVPEQFTMQTQKDLVQMHPNHGISNVDVLSFMRLAYRVFEEQGGLQRVVLEDTGKSMLVRKVISDKKEELKVFRNNVKKTGYISEIKSLISEFYQYDITADELERMITITEKKPLLQRKLEDMRVIYQGFQALLEEKYITTEEILDVLTEKINGSQVLENTVLALDGFTGFTPVQYKLLHRLFQRCEEILVTVTIDPSEDSHKQTDPCQLFYSSREMIEKLKDIAIDENVKIAKDYVLQEEILPRFSKSPYLSCLEYNLFRYPVCSFEKYCKMKNLTYEKEDIVLYAGRNMQQEVQYTIREIYRLVREESYRYRDIAIVTGDMEQYGRVFEKICGKERIPCFIDYKKDILGNPLIELIRSLLDLIRGNFDYESMFRYLRCGLADIEEELTDKLENYVLALGVKGARRWKQLWTRTYDKETDLELLNQGRMEIMEGLEEFCQVFGKKKNTVLAYTTALHEFLQKHSIYRKLKDYEERFEQKGMPLLAKEYAQVYEIVLDIMDRMVELLGTETVTLNEYKDLLETGFMEAKVGLIPPGVDQIMLGDIERTRLKDIKVLFFLGVNEGIVPKSGGSGGILSEFEREHLAEHEIVLAPTARQQVFSQQFYLYLNLTKPQERLYLTYHKVNEEGKEAVPSGLIHTVRKIFPDLTVHHEKNIQSSEALSQEDAERILNETLGKNCLLEGLRNYGQTEPASWWKELYSFYSKQETWQEERERLVDGVCFVNQENRLSKEVAEGLYGKELNNSVTRVERYAACAFAHFLQYGLQLKERQEFQFGGLDFGNIFHEILRIFPQELKEKGFTWRTVPETEMFRIVEHCMEVVTADYGNAILSSSNQNAYLIERMCRIAKRTIWALTEQLKQGCFEPIDYEVSFHYMDGLESAKMELGEERIMRLHGRIDRMDGYDEKDALYVKVMDYKSGNTKFQIENLYYGLQMQLVVYMNAALELQKQKNPKKQVLPAGIFYYNIEDPIIARVEEQEISREILKELQMNGLVNDKEQVITWLDQAFKDEDGLKGSVKSYVIPVETTRDKAIGKRSSVAKEKAFQWMGEYVNHKITKQGKEILDGNIAIEPYRLKDKTACDYCSYRSVCNFDPKLPGNEYRDLKPLSADEVWGEIKKEVEGGNQDEE